MGQDDLPGHVKPMLDKIAQENGFKKPRIEFVGELNKGENYIGQVYRVVLHDDEKGGKEKLSLIIKCSPRNAKRRELLRTKEHFENERFMYESVLPEHLRILKSKGLLPKSQETYPDTAKIHCSRTSEDGDEDTIILKNVSPEGYKTGDRFAGLDAQHCRLVLQQLARLHATSIMLEKEDPDAFNRLVKSSQEIVCIPEFEKSFKSFAEKARTMIEARFPVGTTERTKFEEFADHYNEIMKELVQPDPRLTVFCHGDAWVNNVLFKYDNQNTSVPKSLCFIDFQVVRYASPVTDLAYLLFCSLTKSTRDKHFKQLLLDYHQFLSSSLKEFGCSEKIVSWDEMQDLYRKYMKFGLGMSFITIPIILANNKNMRAVDEVGDASKLDELFASTPEDNPVRDERMSDILQDMVKYGYL